MKIAFATKFIRDQQGQVLILFTIMLPVILGVIGLSLEIGRYWLLNSELQNLADASAIAGAKELDGAPAAIERAKQAARSYLDNSCRNNDLCWSNVPAPGIQILDPVVTDELNGTTATDLNAAFIKVTTIDRQIAPTFLVALGAISNQATRATATAQTIYVACDVHPLMLCNPFEPNGEHFPDAVSNGTVKPGMMFHMTVKDTQTQGGSDELFAAGDFGLLDPPGLDSSGSNFIRNLLSSQSPHFCYLDKDTPRTGQAVQKLTDAINVRFDMVPIAGDASGLDAAPAPNVIKGLFRQSNCDANQRYTPTRAVPLPTDDNLQTIGNLQLGSGILNQAEANAYWMNHYGRPWPNDLESRGQPNRYLAYRRELGLDRQAAPRPRLDTEPIAPLCTPKSADSTVERRIISVAIIDCEANRVRGNKITNFIPKAFANFFLFRPSWNYVKNNSSGGDIWAEFVELVTPEHDASGKIRQIVQLVRDQ